MAQSDPKLLARLSRIEGQIRGLTAMVNEGRYCLDIVTQIRAARAALARVEQVMLATHMSHCVERAMASDDPKEQRKKMAELMELLGRTDR
jgi:CsoR family transcriptional regulator, copper-sensing transcriptional repressor